MPARIPSLTKPRRKPEARPSANSRGYDWNWRKIRAAVLRGEPLCRECRTVRGLLVPAEHVDHIKPLSQGGTHDLENLQPLCHSCHSAKTARQDGGLGNKRG